MKKTILLFALKSLLLSHLFSQEKNERKGYSSIILGASIPTGNFKSENFYNNEAGYANGGILFDIAFAYNFHPKLGVKSIMRGQANPLDAGTYAQDLADFLGEDYAAGSTTVSVQSSVYSLGGMLVGLNGSFPIEKNIKFEPYALIGLSTATLPSMMVESFYYQNKMNSIYQEQATTNSFSYIIGASAKLNLSEQICLLLNLDYYASKAEWNNVRVITVGHVSRTTEVRNYRYEQKFSTINLSGGVGFRF
jgi:hypothetical protein